MGNNLDEDIKKR